MCDGEKDVLCRLTTLLLSVYGAFEAQKRLYSSSSSSSSSIERGSSHFPRFSFGKKNNNFVFLCVCVYTVRCTVLSCVCQVCLVWFDTVLILTYIVVLVI